MSNDKCFSESSYHIQTANSYHERSTLGSTASGAECQPNTYPIAFPGCAVGMVYGRYQPRPLRRTRAYKALYQSVARLRYSGSYGDMGVPWWKLICHPSVECCHTKERRVNALSVPSAC